jgi:hypothetical protein
MATASPICAKTRARRAAYSSGGKISEPLKVGWAASGARQRNPQKNRLASRFMEGRSD